MNTEQQQPKDEILNYVGHFMGSQQRNQGTNKAGQPWVKHDILFHHGDMTKPVRFTWFNDIKCKDGGPVEPGKVYNLAYKMNHFQRSDGTQGKAKQAIVIRVALPEDKLGYQQDQVFKPTVDTPVNQQSASQSTYDGNRANSTQGGIPSMGLDEFIKIYKTKHPDKCTKEHEYYFLVQFMANSRTELMPAMKQAKEKFIAEVIMSDIPEPTEETV